MKSLIIPIKSFPSAQRDNILVLSSSGISTRQIATKTGFSKATIARVIKKAFPNKENIKMGCPSKLTPHDKSAIVHHVLSGETSTAVQATNFINSIIPTPVSTQIVRNTLKAANLKAVTIIFPPPNMSVPLTSFSPSGSPAFFYTYSCPYDPILCSWSHLTR